MSKVAGKIHHLYPLSDLI